MAGLMYPGGSSKVEVQTHTQSWSSGVPTSYILQYDCKCCIVRYSRSGYGGSSVSVSGSGFSSLGSFDTTTEHSFGKWGKLYGISYGINQKKGNVVTLNNSGNLNAGGNVYAVYII